MVSNYETAGTTGTVHDRGIPAGTGSVTTVTPDVNVVTSAVTPTDRVRWGPIFAGLFATLSTLVVLSVLGAAVAGSTFDPGDNARNYGWGAGIWSAVSMLIAFCVGGWLAARTAAVRGRDNGLLNGTMVWVVAIPLMLWMISSAVGAAARTAANAAGALDRQQISQATDAMRSSDSPANSGDAVQQSTQQVTQSTQAQGANSPANQERAADAMARSAWGTLIALLLSLGAAAAGGFLGARSTDNDHRRHDARLATPAA